MKLDDAELFDLKMRRQNKPPTKAKEAKFYRDPAQSVEFESELKRREVKKKRKEAAKPKGK